MAFEQPREIVQQAATIRLGAKEIILQRGVNSQGQFLRLIEEHAGRRYSVILQAEHVPELLATIRKLFPL